jgi:hypothetical protein
MSIEAVVRQLEQRVQESLTAQREACEAMAEAAIEIIRLRNENNQLRRLVGLKKLANDMRADKVSMFHVRQAE